MAESWHSRARDATRKALEVDSRVHCLCLHGHAMQEHGLPDLLVLSPPALLGTVGLEVKVGDDPLRPAQRAKHLKLEGWGIPCLVARFDKGSLVGTFQRLARDGDESLAFRVQVGFHVSLLDVLRQLSHGART